jgi:uracil phosphoribosyltransferase
VKVFNHPIIGHYLSVLRDKTTDTERFAQTVEQMASLMVYEITQDLPQVSMPLQTPLTETTGVALARQVVLVPILRAGLGMVDGVRRFIPNAIVGHIGLYRDETTLQPTEYFSKVPKHISSSIVYVLDPMLATGASALKAIELLKAQNVKDIRLVCLLGAPEGVELIERAYPDVKIYLGALDEKLDGSGYIVPGLGDAGDRIFGTE